MNPGLKAELVKWMITYGDAWVLAEPEAFAWDEWPYISKTQRNHYLYGKDRCKDEDKDKADAETQYYVRIMPGTVNLLEQGENDANPTSK
jgi:hypothetical protein